MSTVNPSIEQARELYQAQRFAECERACREILARDPDQAEALSMLGYLALHGGVPELAVSCFERAAALEPEYAPHHGVLATALRLLGRHDEALSAQERCVELDADNAEALTNLAGQYAEAGLMTPAVETYNRALALRPDLGAAHYGLALISRFSPDDPRIPVMATQLRRDDLADADRVGIAFSMGRAQDDLGEYDRAFGYFQDANRLKRASLHYDRAAADADVDTLSKAFTEDVMARFRDSGFAAGQPVFVVGMPRSGSTLLEQVLSSHPDVHGAGELPHAAQVAAQTFAMHAAAGRSLPAALANMQPGDWSAMGEAYAGKLSTLAPGAARIIDKQLYNYMMLGAIHLMLPQARIIHCVRDPVDTCVSCFTHNFGAGAPYACDLSELGHAYGNYRKMMDHWLDVLQIPVLEVVYEDLVVSLESQARRALDFLGLAWSDQCLDFARSDRPVTTSSLAQVREAVYATSVGRWRRFEKHLAPLEEALSSSNNRPPACDT